MSVYLLVTLDTKGLEAALVRDRLLQLGVPVTVVDTGCLGQPVFGGDVTREQVFRAAGTTLEAAIAENDRGGAVSRAAGGAATVRAAGVASAERPSVNERHTQPATRSTPHQRPLATFIRHLVLPSLMPGACGRDLLGRSGAVLPSAVVIDQYARNTTLLERSAELPEGCRLITRTKGEADPAVAAASILARAAFVRGLRELGHEFGFTFPPGAGRPVLEAGAAFVRTFGRERLDEVAKLHFATTAQIG